MRLELLRIAGKEGLFLLKKVNGKAIYLIRKKKRKIPEAWEIVDMCSLEVSAEVCYFQRLILPGCRIIIEGREAAVLKGRISLSERYDLEGSEYDVSSEPPYPFTLKRGGKTVAGLGLVRPGEEIAYELFIDETEDFLLCFSIITGRILCSGMTD